MNDDKTLREAVRAILSEAWHDDGLPDEVDRSRVPLKASGLEFTVSTPDGEEVSVHVNYDERRPFDVEIWKAEDMAGREVDVDMLKTVVPNLEDQAWMAVERKYL